MRTKGATDKKPRKRAGYYLYQEKKRQAKLNPTPIEESKKEASDD